MAQDLEEKIGRVGLKMNTNKTKVFSLIYHRNFPVYINGSISWSWNNLHATYVYEERIGGIGQFENLGSVFSDNRGVELHFV